MNNHGSTSRRHVNGVPTSCWCGKELATFVSETNENPYQRFYRCVVAMQRKHEDHLFKWEDEAFLDEIRMLQVQQREDETFLDEIHKLQVQQRRLEADVDKWKMMKTREDTHVGCVGAIEWLCGKLCNREE